MTAKDGFVYGLTTGFICYIALLILPNVGFPEVKVLSSYAFAILVFVSLGLPIASLAKGKEVLGTTIGGGVFGFTAVYQVAYILTTIWQGNLPCL